MISMHLRAALRVVALIALSTGPLAGTACAFENRVVIESATVTESTADVRIGIRVEFGTPMGDFVFPLEIRTVEGSAFWDVTSCEQFTVSLGYPDNFYQLIQSCGSGPQCTSSVDCVDGISPDPFFAAVLGRLGSQSPPGIYPDLVEIQFDVGPDVGRFVIDTSFIPPDNHLAFADHFQIYHPAFTRGEICVNPAGWGDMTDDGAHDIADIVALIDHFFRHAPPPPDSRADYNCDGRTNLVDVVRLIDTLLRDKRAPCCPWGAP